MTTLTSLPPTINASREIHILPAHLVNKIAAGEVVDRPASVVKELVENALDAGATKIAIDASHGGRTLRIADNGIGMTADNAVRAFLNHATSKIQTDADLERIATFGFRGEALASIAAVSEMTCLTRTADADHGTRITIAADGTPQATPTGCAPGTIMDIQQLFASVPARLKFLKKPATELAHVEETVQRLALAHPGVQFTLMLDGREALKTTGSGQLATAFEEIYRVPATSREFIPAKLTDDDSAVHGLISLPSVMKSSRKFVLTYVNGRAIKCSTITKAVEAAYQSLLPHGKSPFVCLFLTLPLDAVDVNVHPTKREVRYAQPNHVFGLVKSAIRQAMESHGITGSFAPAYSATMPTPNAINGVYGNTGHTPTPGNPAWRPTVVSSTNNESARQAAFQFHAPLSNSEDTGFSSNNTAETEPVTKVQVIGQLFNTYILLETPQGLMVVDQHIASERTVFEALKQAEDTANVDTQQVLAGPVIHLSPEQREALQHQEAALHALGFRYAATADGVQLTSVPMIYLEKHNPHQWFDEALTQLADSGSAELDREHLLATMACHRAVRAGDVLTHSEMEQVISQWLACRLPWTCPHGRPIAHTIKAEDLNRFFHRPSLPVNAMK